MQVAGIAVKSLGRFAMLIIRHKRITTPLQNQFDIIKLYINETL
ncbi:hypothetical protein C900_04469 [Fulvivirga imtechensis AK7]|uniref:Uncharacterized protein n=1 Tax=Fulvivirga imtechensis AK7 TaxID=1237149 RepID=L8JLY5_9BACT|nr:hypothetical protein C900_04469 [Fulvivirga imtechensis AK7]